MEQQRQVFNLETSVHQGTCTVSEPARPCATTNPPKAITVAALTMQH